MANNLGLGDNTRAARTSSSASGGDGGGSRRSAEDPSDNPSVPAFSLEAAYLLAGICDHPRVVSAIHTAVDELHARLMPADGAQVRAWVSQISRDSPIMSGARVAYGLGWGLGRGEAAEPTSSRVITRNKSALLQHILRSLSGGAQ